MVEIRIHGRGGQGAVVASEVLVTAAFLEGKFVQSFPLFGVERRGAPVMAFARISDKPIRARYSIYNPDHIIVLDPTLIEAVNVAEGLKPGGWVLINSPHPPSFFQPSLPGYRVATVNASSIAVAHRLGTSTAPIVNTAILGAFSRITGIVSLDSLAQAIRKAMPFKPEDNVAAAQEAFEKVIF